MANYAVIINGELSKNRQLLRGETKRHVIHIARHGAAVTFSSVSEGAYQSDSEVIGMNLEKHRKKVKRTHRDENYVQHTEILSPAHWLCYRYVFSIDWLKANKLRVVQGKRTFKLVRNRV